MEVYDLIKSYSKVLGVVADEIKKLQLGQSVELDEQEAKPVDSKWRVATVDDIGRGARFRDLTEDAWFYHELAEMCEGATSPFIDNCIGASGWVYCEVLVDEQA